MDLQPLVERIREVDGVGAVVLGGSRARGTHTPKSDFDLGIYYNRSLDLHALDRVAMELDDRHVPGLLTEIGGWGPWIDGGGWLTVQGQAVDFLYRDLDRVSECLEDCRAGRVEIVYQPGHPHGFVTSIYVAELALGQVLWDGDGRLSELKGRTRPYPEALKKGLVRKFAWEIDFSLRVARKGIERADVSYAAGCCFRCVSCLLQVLFAVNEQYWMNEKGAVALADTFPIRPENLRARIERAFALLPVSIEEAVALLEELSSEIPHLSAPLPL